WQNFQARAADLYFCRNPDAVRFLRGDRGMSGVQLNFIPMNLADGAPFRLEHFGSARRETGEKSRQFPAVCGLQGKVHELMGDIQRGTSRQSAGGATRTAPFW